MIQENLGSCYWKLFTNLLKTAHVITSHSPVRSRRIDSVNCQSENKNRLRQPWKLAISALERSLHIDEKELGGLDRLGCWIGLHLGKRLALVRSNRRCVVGLSEGL